MDLIGDRTLRDLLEERVALYGDREVLVFEDRDGAIERFSYRQFDARVNQVANGLLAEGIRADYREALSEFEKGLRARPDWYGLHNGIGWCHLKLGRKAEARAAFQRALTLRPGYEDAVEGLRQASG